MGFTKRKHLTNASACIAEPRNVSALGWLLAQIVLIYVVTMESVAIAEVMLNIDRSLIDIDWCSRS